MNINLNQVIKFTTALGAVIASIEGVLYQYNVMTGKKPKKRKRIKTNKFNDYNNKDRRIRL